jgi:RNA polymerase sigma-70 factor (ECF subfamily)
MSIGEFDRIYQQHAPAVFRVCLRSVSRREIAEEITSEVFLALYQNWDQIDRGQLPAWLFTVAKRRAADYWRHYFVEERWSQDYKPVTAAPEPTLPLDDLLSRCASLKPVHRLCIILRFVQGMSRDEIAKKTGLSELQVKGHLQYGLRLIRQQLFPDANFGAAQESVPDA